MQTSEREFESEIQIRMYMSLDKRVSEKFGEIIVLEENVNAK